MTKIGAKQRTISEHALVLRLDPMLRSSSYALASRLQTKRTQDRVNRNHKAPKKTKISACKLANLVKNRDVRLSYPIELLQKKHRLQLKWLVIKTTTTLALKNHKVTGTLKCASHLKSYTRIKRTRLLLVRLKPLTCSINRIKKWLLTKRT